MARRPGAWRGRGDEHARLSGLPWFKASGLDQLRTLLDPLWVPSPSRPVRGWSGIASDSARNGEPFRSSRAAM